MAQIQSKWCITRRMHDGSTESRDNLSQPTAMMELRLWKADANTIQMFADIRDSAGTRLSKHTWERTPHGWNHSTKI